MMYRLGWINWARLIIWLAIGLVVYFTYGQKHSKVQARRNSGSQLGRGPLVVWSLAKTPALRSIRRRWAFA